MAEIKIPVAPFGWSAAEPADPTKFWRWARNLDTHTGRTTSSKGYVKHRQVAASKVNKAALSRIHVSHTDKKYRWFYLDANLYKDDGATPTSLVGSLTAKHGAATFNDPSRNLSGWLPGTNSQAQIVRQDAAGTDIEAVAMDMGAPTLASAIGGTSGGSLADATYRVRVAWIDDASNVVDVVYSAPSDGTHNTSGVVVSGGGGSGKITVTIPGSAPARATKWRIGVTAAGGADTPSAYLYGADVAIGTSSQDITTVATTVFSGGAFNESGAGTYRQAHMPIDDVDICVMHQGSLWVGSTKNNQIAKSVRGNPNMWFSDTVIKAGTDTGWHGLLRGLASTGGVLYAFTDRGVNVVYGSFGRDDQGPEATYAWDARTEPLDDADCVGHRTITVIDGRVLWLSSKGPMIISGGRPEPLGHRDIRAELACWDWTNMARAHAAEDPQNRYWCLAVPRKTNSSRPMDGASTAGICDTVYRWDFVHGLWACPLAVETVDLDAQQAISQGATTPGRVGLWAMGPHGSSIRFEPGRSGGTTDGVVTAATYDGILCSAETTTSATFAMTGISADDLVGETLLIYYPTVDTGFPGVYAVKTISSNTATSGGNITASWQGALTVPSSTKWTVRRAGWLHDMDWRCSDIRQLIQGLPPDARILVQGVRLEFADEVGAEAVA